jgi:hypothetical protein
VKKCGAIEIDLDEIPDTACPKLKKQVYQYISGKKND